jgi:hypothetical protein
MAASEVVQHLYFGQWEAEAQRTGPRIKMFAGKVQALRWVWD